MTPKSNWDEVSPMPGRFADDEVELVNVRPSDDDLAPGQLIDNRYRVLSLIGRGGFGSVYRVVQLLTKKEYALKTLNSKYMSEVLLLRFRAEARAASKLDHSNLVRAVDFGLIDEREPYLVMELVEGPTLAQLIKERTKLSIGRALRIFIPICFALDYAHSQGVIHRDIKPSNIILARQPDSNEFLPKIVDFGIAKIQFSDESQVQTLTQTGDIFGTPLYMSPEQCTGKGVDQRSDIYSLGCVLFEALSGTPPYRGNSPLETMMQHGASTIPTLREASLGEEFPAALEQIVAKMLAKEPNDRFKSFAHVAQQMLALQAGDTLPISDPGKANYAKPSRGLRKAKSTPSWNNLGVLAAGIMLGGTACFAIMATIHPEKRTSEKQNYPEFGRTFPQEPSAVQGFYSHASGESKIFNFPKADNEIGVVYWQVPASSGARAQAPKIEHKPASGLVEIPRKARVILEYSLKLLKGPELLREFKRDDLYGAVLRSSDGLNTFLDANVTEEALRYLGLQDNFKVLSLTEIPLHDVAKALKFLKNLNEIEWFEVRRMHELTGERIAQLPWLGNVKTLSLHSVDNVTPILQRLAQESSIEKLAIMYTNYLSRQDLRLIARLPHLRVLSLIGPRQMVSPDLSVVSDELCKSASLKEFHCDLSYVDSIDKVKPLLRKKLVIYGIQRQVSYIKKLFPAAEVRFYDQLEKTGDPDFVPTVGGFSLK